MRKFGAPTPKRTMIISNSALIGNLDLGPLSKQERVVGEEFKTCKKYLNRDGVARYSGTKALKATQCLVIEMSSRMYTKDLSTSLCNHYCEYGACLDMFGGQLPRRCRDGALVEHHRDPTQFRNNNESNLDYPKELTAVVALFKDTPWSTCEVAEVTECLVYLRGSEALRIPREWSAVIPSLDELQHMQSL